VKAIQARDGDTERLVDLHGPMRAFTVVSSGPTTLLALDADGTPVGPAESVHDDLEDDEPPWWRRGRWRRGRNPQSWDIRSDGSRRPG
jgi:hypothetical protein